MAKYKVEGMKELQNSINRLGKLPQSSVTPAANAGAKIALRAARSKAPYETGELRKGIVIKGERKTAQGKKVYDVMMDAAKNDIFVKMSKDGKKRWYYPASQEYGFTIFGKYIPGFNYLKDSITNNVSAIKVKVIETLTKKIDQAWKKG